jgi:polygalacturonase
MLLRVDAQHVCDPITRHSGIHRISDSCFHTSRHNTEGKPTVNVTARRVYSGCRGGFTIGSEMSGGVQNVTFEDSVSTGESGIRISSELGRGVRCLVL